MAKKRVYFFGNRKAEGNATMKELLTQLYIIEQRRCFKTGILNGLQGRGGLGCNILSSHRRGLAAKVIGAEFVQKHYVCHDISPVCIVATQAAPPPKPGQVACSYIIYFGHY